MFLNITSLLVGFLCLFVVVLMLFNSKPNRKTNVFLVVILFFAGVQRFINAIEALELTKLTYSPLKLRLSVAFFIVPVYYLFFKRLIKGNTMLKQELLHFVLPIILLLIDIFIVGYGLSYYIFLAFSCCYFGAILLLVRELIKNKKRSLFEEANYNTIRTWTLLMTLITFSLVVFSNYFLFSEAKSAINLNNFYRYSSVLWLITIIYIFKNPVIIFGEYNLLKNIQSNELQELLVWSKKTLRTIEEKDKIIYNNIANKIGSIILSIQKLQKSAPAITSFTFNTDTLAKELKIPRSHVELIFRYYCHYSVNDFSNLVKINYAVSLINEGYLENYTVAHLGGVCLFNSRFTFSKNFKKFIGVSVSDYVINNANINNKTDAALA
jgi:AraC-like DNA-binding protein